MVGVFINRLKTTKVRFGFDPPSVAARDVFNPILNFLDE